MTKVVLAVAIVLAAASFGLTQIDDRDQYPSTSPLGPKATTPAEIATTSQLPVSDAAIVYVSPSGTDSAAGTAHDPLQTIQAGLSKAQPGMTVQVLPGRYREHITSVRDGAELSPITLAASKGVSVSAPDGDGRLFELKHDYHTITGFDFSHADILLYLTGASHSTISHNTFHHALGECVRLKYFSQYNYITENTIHDCGREDYVLDGDGKNGEGVYIGTAPEQLDRNPDPRPDGSNYNTVSHNTFDIRGNECVDIKEAAAHNLIEHNSCTGQLDQESGGISIRGSSNTLQHNHVFGNKGAGIRLGGDEDSHGLHNNVIMNRLENNDGFGLKVTREPQGTVCGNTFTNNFSGLTNRQTISNPACDN